MKAPVVLLCDIRCLVVFSLLCYDTKFTILGLIKLLVGM